MSERLGFIICVEDYSENRFGHVPYARKDGNDIRNLFHQVFKIRDERLFTFFDSAATHEIVSDSLSDWLRQPEAYEFYFYYAGHGLYSHGQNWLTVFDSHPDHIQGTAISLKRDIIDKLGRASKALLFLDTCSSFLFETPAGRPVQDLQFTQRDGPTCVKSAVYLSSSPGEAAVSCARLKQGVWTSSLIKGLSDYSPAVDGAGDVTDVSLRDYLSSAVYRHIAECSAHVESRRQTPQSFLTASETFILTRPKSRPPTSAEVVGREDALIAAYKGYQTAAEAAARASGVKFERDDTSDPVLGNIFGDHYGSKALNRVNQARRAIEQIGRARGTWSEATARYKFVGFDEIVSDALPAMTNFLHFVIERFRTHPYSVNFLEALRVRYLGWIEPDLDSVRIVHIDGVTYLETQLRKSGHNVVLDRLALDFISDFTFNPDTSADEVGTYLFEKFDVYSLLMIGVAERIFTAAACNEAAIITEANGGPRFRAVELYYHPDHESALD